MSVHSYQFPTVTPEGDPSLPPTLEPHTIINGRFRIIEPLVTPQPGKKGLLIADDFENRALEPVVVTVAPPDDREVVTRVTREDFVLRNATHPHILPSIVSGTFTTPVGDTIPFHVTQHGERDMRSFSVGDETAAQEFMQRMADIGGAVGYLIDEGIVHRDLKPQNYIIDGPHTYLADLELAAPTPEAFAEAHLTGPLSADAALGIRLERELPLAAFDPGMEGTDDFAAPERLFGPSTPQTEAFAFCAAGIQMCLGQKIWHYPTNPTTAGGRILFRELSVTAEELPETIPIEGRKLLIAGVDPQSSSRALVPDIQQWLASEGFTPSLVQD